MKKQVWKLILLVSALVLLTGCKKVVKEAQIETDLQQYPFFLAEGEQLTEVKVTKRETEKKKNLDVVYCDVSIKDEKKSYIKGAVLTYIYDKEYGWGLSYVSVNQPSEWTVAPLSGVTDDIIYQSLERTPVEVEGDNWTVSESDLTSVTIDEHTTDLENKTDTVIVSLTIKSSVQQAEGQLKLTYLFDSDWKLDDTSKVDDFTVSSITGTEFNGSDDKLLMDLDGKTIVYGENSTRSQEILINKSEISNFNVESKEESQRGAHVTCVCTGTMTKGHAEFAITATLSYQYSGGWSLVDSDISVECTSVNIVGKWSGAIGTFGTMGCELDIAEMDDDGNITGTYSCTGNNIEDPYSYNVSGQIDRRTLVITLKAGEMISELPRRSFEPDDIEAALYVDEDAIEGSVDFDYFTISQ